MFTMASSANRLVTNALSITYTVERRKDGDVYWYKVTRHAAKTYRYLDLTPTAAATVMAAKVMKYTRTTRKCISRTLDKTFESITSNISTSLNGNGSYDVVIGVMESDSTHSASIPADPSSLFAAENARDYDEGEGGITIASTSYDGNLTITFNVSGEAVGALITDVGLFYDGTRVTTGVSVYQTAEKSYRIKALNWPQAHNQGEVRIGAAVADWTYAIPSLTLVDYSNYDPSVVGQTTIMYSEELTFDGIAPSETGVEWKLYDEIDYPQWVDITHEMNVFQVRGNTIEFSGFHLMYRPRVNAYLKAVYNGIESNMVHLTYNL